jgi:hypothetical protein
MSVNANVSLGVSGGVAEAKKLPDEQQDSLRHFSVFIVCTCGKAGVTTALPSWNILNCLFAYWFTEFWCCYMCAKRKEFSCVNAQHTCKHCNNVFGSYSAC